MEANKILQSDVLDVIFDNRNKSYGAYELRKNYSKRARKAVFFTFVFALLAISGPIVATLNPSQNPIPIPIQDLDTIKITHIVMPETKKIEPIQKHIEHRDITTRAVDQLATKIVKTTDVIKDKKIKDILPNAVDGAEDHVGTQTGFVVDKLPEGKSGGEEIIEEVIELPIEKPNDHIYTTIDDIVEPEFLGGEDELMAFLKNNIKYPKRAIDENVKGRVVLGFVVDKEGNIEEVKVVKHIGAGCDEEAVRVIHKMPKWKPGKHNGKPVSVYFNLPISFELEEY